MVLATALMLKLTMLIRFAWLKQIDKGSVDELITSLKGKKITLKKIRQAMEESFGKGASKSVGLRCDRKNQLTELWIGLYGDPATSSLEEMLKAGEKAIY